MVLDSATQKHLKLSTLSLNLDKYRRATVELNWSPPETDPDRVLSFRCYAEPASVKPVIKFDVIPASASIAPLRPIFNVLPGNPVQLTISIEDDAVIPEDARVEFYFRRLEERDIPKSLNLWQSATESFPVGHLENVNMPIKAPPVSDEPDRQEPNRQVARQMKETATDGGELNGDMNKPVEEAKQKLTVTDHDETHIGIGSSYARVLISFVAIVAFLVFSYFVIYPVVLTWWQKYKAPFIPKCEDGYHLINGYCVQEKKRWIWW